MDKKLNLCEILKGHEEETFYSKAHGNVKFEKIQEYYNNVKKIICSYVSSISCRYECSFISNGKMVDTGEIILVPSKDQQDWNKWDKENNHKTPKTWSDLVASNKYKKEVNKVDTLHWYRGNTPIEKSVEALLKIHQLIEFCYGGNVTTEEWKDLFIKCWCITYDEDEIFSISSVALPNSFIHISFHTKEQAEEFLSYPENIQLLKDYYMIN